VWVCVCVCPRVFVCVCLRVCVCVCACAWTQSWLRCRNNVDSVAWEMVVIVVGTHAPLPNFVSKHMSIIIFWVGQVKSCHPGRSLWTRVKMSLAHPHSHTHTHTHIHTHSFTHQVKSLNKRLRVHADLLARKKTHTHTQTHWTHARIKTHTHTHTHSLGHTHTSSTSGQAPWRAPAQSWCRRSAVQRTWGSAGSSHHRLFTRGQPHRPVRPLLAILDHLLCVEGAPTQQCKLAVLQCFGKWHACLTDVMLLFLSVLYFTANWLSCMSTSAICMGVVSFLVLTLLWFTTHTTDWPSVHVSWK
jgi:hypothetical protein